MPYARSTRPILIGIGSNLPCGRAAPRAMCEAALACFNDHGLRIVRRSGWYETQPVPMSDQPRFVNGAVLVDSALSPARVLMMLQRIERRFGRRRQRRNAPRRLDLDLLAYGSVIRRRDAVLCLPHPRLHERAFVLRPLCDIAPDWRHPVTGRTPAQMLRGVDVRQSVRILD